MLLKRLLEKSNKAVAILFLIIALFGFFDASYLTTKHYQGVPPACSVLKGCETVTSSQYSVIFGVPVALLGAVYYLAVIVLAAIYIDGKSEKVLRGLATMTILGMAASSWLVFLQVFVIGAICIYCMFSAFTSTLLFVLGMFTLRSYGAKNIYMFPEGFFKKWENILGIIRIGMGFLFFWGFIDKLPAWMKGVSPTLGFLSNTKGTFSFLFQSMAGSILVEYLFMAGLLCIGVSLILGIGLKIATTTGMILMLLMFLASFPPAHNPLVDEHFFYFLLIYVFRLTNAGNFIGLGKAWTKLPLIKKYPILA